MDFGLIILCFLTFVAAIGSLFALVVSRGLLAHPVSARQKWYTGVLWTVFLLVGLMTYKVHYLDEGLIGAVGRHDEYDVKETARYLRLGANPSVDFEGHTPLMTAVNDDNTAVVKLLIENGADVNQKANSLDFGIFGQTTPLKAAMKRENTQIIKMLRDAGAKPE